jgi:succinate dehydrogenase / fumarate reductase, cytochrome b subunit
VFLSIGSILLVYWLWALASGAERYARAMECLSSTWVKWALLGLMFCFFYHLSNGIRHLAWDLGYGYEKRQARASGWVVVIAAVTLTAVAAFMILRWTGQELGGEV